MNNFTGKQRLAVLGSTGSVGRQTLEVVRAFPERLSITALAAGHNLALLSEQISEFRPEFISYASTESPLPGNFTGTQRKTIDEIASLDEVDTVVMATSDKSGLGPTLAAVRAGKTVALASKEALVMAGEIILRTAGKTGARILPVDSEHSAIWQCLQGEANMPHRLILTASGGPFRRYTKAQLTAVTPEQALKHPSWRMGKKITIDSATLMNKGLEVIEAHHLFDMPYKDISVLVHPQSIIHSMVEFADGVIKAQL
ncbi:MAG: 1-deoxy-D-xylulose-5-phosphate reductoisomerase, partial [Chloroflexota bacterium]